MRITMLLSAAMLALVAALPVQAAPTPSTLPKLSKQTYLAWLATPDAADQILDAAASDQTIQAAAPSLDEVKTGVQRLISDRNMAVALFDHLDKDGDG